MAKKKKMNFSKELLKHAKAAGIKPDPKWTEEELQRAVVVKISDLVDPEYDKLPQETKDWSNEVIATLKGGGDSGEEEKPEKETKVEKAEKKKVAEAKEKAKTAVKDDSASRKEKGKNAFKEGSSAWHIHQILLKAKKGITAEDATEKAEKLIEKGEFESSNVKGRVARIFGVLVKWEMAEKKDDKFVAIN